MHRTGKKIAGAALLIMAVFGLTGCSNTDSKSVPEVKLSVWWSEEDERELLEQTIEAFQEEYADEALFQITVSIENVVSTRETVLANPQAAADIYILADDQFETLRRAGALLEITEDTEQVIEDNGGKESGACRAAMYEDKLYAYPFTAGNGYFLYYNADYFTEEDVKSFDRILDVCADNDKKMAMDYSSGWYIYSFFKGAGLDLAMNEDGITNACNWNAKDTPYTGVDVAEAMLRIAAHEGFVNCDDEGFIKGVQSGDIIAGINGAWNAEQIKKVWGDGFAAVKLPRYTIAGDSVQMCSFSGYKLLGVNPSSENCYWAMKLAQRLSDEEMQTKRFEMTGDCPSNVKAAMAESVQASPVIAALVEQEQYADAQRIADTYWNPSSVFGITIAGGNPDGQDLQYLLDTMVEGITAQPK